VELTAQLGSDNPAVYLLCRKGASTDSLLFKLDPVFKTTSTDKMAPPKAVLTAKAPQPIPQLSQAVKYNGMVYCSGSLGIDPATGKFVEGTVKDRTVYYPS
jgi:hypothetical protein